MANEKQINSRIQQKHDIEANWLKSVFVDGNVGAHEYVDNPFIPKAGEIIIYDCDDNYNYARFKIGDGVHNVWELSFVNDDIINRL
jgi:hypothetical protein